MMRDCCYDLPFPNIPRGCGKTQSILEQLCTCKKSTNDPIEKDILLNTTVTCTDDYQRDLRIWRFLYDDGTVRASAEIPTASTNFKSITPTPRLLDAGYKEIVEKVKRRYNEINNRDPQLPCTDDLWSIINYIESGIPKVVRVDTYNDRVVKVTFTDGSFTKSVCGKNDIFDLDVGITICVMKKMLGKNGHKFYNDMIRDIHATMEKNKKEEELAKQLKNEAKQRKRKAELKKAAKLVKAKQEYIDAQKTAVVEALRAYKEESGDDMK